MNETKLRAQGFRFYEQLWVVDDMNDFGSGVMASTYYEQLNAIVDLKGSKS